jgi:hypothetical protein
MIEHNSYIMMTSSKYGLRHSLLTKYKRKQTITFDDYDANNRIFLSRWRIRKAKEYARTVNNSTFQVFSVAHISESIENKNYKSDKKVYNKVYPKQISEIKYEIPLQNTDNIKNKFFKDKLNPTKSLVSDHVSNQAVLND